ncbi:MAG: GHKL domain-containing protein [Bacteroidales bacterium]|nr:GHKL domain-containing protein [Bacteroidales bacterium]
MQNRDEFYGVIVLVRSGANKHYDQKDYEFARELIRRAALALENAKLYSQSQDINAELEKRVAFRTKELEASNNELESFSYSVSHDLRAPLRSIDGFSNRILKEYSHKLDDQGVDYFMRVKNASQKMGFLIDDLLKLAHFSRIEMNLVEINLSVMAESIAQELQSSEPDRKVVFKIEKDIVAKVDQVLFSVVFQNLIGNAWKYSRNQKKAIIEFGTLQKKGKLIYFIRDNGVGFDMNYVEKLFGAFQRLHSSKEFEGNGVGLATVQRIIRRHHGNIWTEGEMGKGATFYFSLPAE